MWACLRRAIMVDHHPPAACSSVAETTCLNGNDEKRQAADEEHNQRRGKGDDHVIGRCRLRALCHLLELRWPETGPSTRHLGQVTGQIRLGYGHDGFLIFQVHGGDSLCKQRA